MISDVITVGITNRFAARALVQDMTHDVMNLLDSVRSAEDQKQNTRVLTVFLPCKVFEHVFANQLLRGAMTRVAFCHNRVGVSFGQLRARSEHSASNQIESGAGNQSANDAAGAGFPHGIGWDNGVSKLF